MTHGHLFQSDESFIMWLKFYEYILLCLTTIIKSMQDLNFCGHGELSLYSVNCCRQDLKTTVILNQLFTNNFGEIW